MDRRTTMLRLHKSLLAYRQRIHEKLAGELGYLHDGKAADPTGDNADLAFEGDGDEMSSRLAELDDRELSQVQRAVMRWNQGVYGICENCQKSISSARLNALPCAPLCITCEREMEKHLDGQGRQRKGNWGHIFDTQAYMQDQRINFSELEKDMSASPRG